MTSVLTPAKIMAALKKMAKSSPGQSINELQLILALERVVARLEKHSNLSEHLVFKGGFVLLKTLPSQRLTHDVDALATGFE